MDIAKLLTEFTPPNPVPLAEDEEQRATEILAISTKDPIASGISKLYYEYKKLMYKQKGSLATEIVFGIVSKFLDKKHDFVFKQWQSGIPERQEGDQYGGWTRSALNQLSQKELYTFLMDHFLRNYDCKGGYFKIISHKKEKNAIVEHIQTKVLDPKDMLAARAGDSSREISPAETMRLLEFFLEIAKTI